MPLCTAAALPLPLRLHRADCCPAALLLSPSLSPLAPRSEYTVERRERRRAMALRTLHRLHNAALYRGWRAWHAFVEHARVADMRATFAAAQDAASRALAEQRRQRGLEVI